MYNLIESRYSSLDAVLVWSCIDFENIYLSVSLKFLVVRVLVLCRWLVVLPDMRFCLGSSSTLFQQRMVGYKEYDCSSKSNADVAPSYHIHSLEEHIYKFSNWTLGVCVWGGVVYEIYTFIWTNQLIILSFRLWQF